jgi:acetaldehyde dehydrogenase (acetylating)
MEMMKVAILGSGNIGTDLLIKIKRSRYLECTLFIGRHLDSPGMNRAGSLGVKVSDLSIGAIVKDPDCCELLFDATSAIDHMKHWPILRELGKTVIDMTPSGIGKMCIPAINMKECLGEKNVNMVTCGGQASVPLAYALSQVHRNIEYIEVVSSIASRSAGPATRLNLDEYVETTERAIQHFSGCKKAKAIIILNPAQPCVDMQTTLFAKISNPDMGAIQASIDGMLSRIQDYVPGYQIVVPPSLANGRFVVTVKVQGLGDYLPKYAGNMDIINSAAISMAEEYARSDKREQKPQKVGADGGLCQGF